MTLVITLIAAVVSTVIWYTSKKARELNVVALVFMFWGASLMWLVDAIVEFIEVREQYFMPELSDMINDTFLGFSVVAFALVIWVISFLIKDPSHVIMSKNK